MTRPSALRVQTRVVHGHRRAFVKAGKGPALLLLHGLGCDHTTWSPVIGRLARRFQMVKIPHIQELTYTQGPLQRRLGVAHVRFDLVPGSVKVTARDIEDTQARMLVDALRTRTLPALEPADELGVDAGQGPATGRR